MPLDLLDKESDSLLDEANALLDKSRHVGYEMRPISRSLRLGLEAAIKDAETYGGQILSLRHELRRAEAIAKEARVAIEAIIPALKEQPDFADWGNAETRVHNSGETLITQYQRDGGS